MSRRPWVGVGLSVALHVGVCLLIVGLFTPDDWLPALVVDLREDFVAGTAAVRSRVGGSTPDTAAPGSAPRRARAAKRDAGSPPARAAEAPAPPAPAPAAPAAPPALAAPPAPAVIAESVPLEPAPVPSPALEAPREPPPAASPSPRESSSSRSLAGLSSADTPRPHAADGGGGSDGDRRASGSPASGSGGSAAVSTDRPGTGTAGRGGPGLALATPGSGSGVGAEYGPYLTALRQRIAQSVRYPASARRRGISGTVNVEILILPNGVVGEVQLLESSTHPVLDEAALETIRSLPRMPLPADLPARPLRVRVPVVFQIH